MSLSKLDPDGSVQNPPCLICYAETKDVGAQIYISSLCQLLHAEGLDNMEDMPVDLCSLCHAKVITLDQVIAQVTTLVNQIEEIRQGFITQLGGTRDEDQFQDLNLLRHHISSQYEANYSESVIIEALDPLNTDDVQTEIFELTEVQENDMEITDGKNFMPSPLPSEIEDSLLMIDIKSEAINTVHSDIQDSLPIPTIPMSDIKPELIKTKKCSVILEKLEDSKTRVWRSDRKRKKTLKGLLHAEADRMKKRKLSNKNGTRAVRLKKLLKRARVESGECNGSFKSEMEGNSKSFPCSYESCTKKFQKESCLSFHVKKIHEGSKFPYACPHCDQCFNASRKLSIHKTRHTQSKDSVECSQCNRILAGEDRLKIHLEKQGGVCKLSSLPCESRIDESDKTKKFVCGVCSYRCRSRNTLKFHCYKHTKERPFPCDICSSSFTRKQDLRHHQEARHSVKLDDSNDDDCRIYLNPYECKICSKVYSTPASLKMHQVQHTKEYKMHCPVCGQGMPNKCKLDLHMVVHTTERSFLCDLCPTTFKRVDKLKRHKLNVHTKSRPFLCDSCPKAFGDNFGLQRHINLMQSQNTEKKFLCTPCNISFTLKDYLLVHQKSKKHKSMLLRLEGNDALLEHILVEEKQVVLEDRGSDSILGI